MYLGHFHPFGFFCFILIVGLLVANIITWRRRGRMCYHTPPSNALSILENRLAKGEISITEYNEVKETLQK